MKVSIASQAQLQGEPLEGEVRDHN
jgi:hypothetical protein